MFGILWGLWGIGWIFVIGTIILLRKVNADLDLNHERNYLDEKPLKVKFLMFVLMGISIVLVGGIINGIWIGSVFKPSSEEPLLLNILLVILFWGFPAILTYVVGFCVCGLFHIKSKLVHAIFIFILIISIVCWTIPVMKYNENIEIKEQTSISSTAEYDLYYFCNIPVQEISGNVNGSLIFGTGNVSGAISSADKLPYWYDNGNGEGL